MADSEQWYVYIIKCADRTLYTGISKNLEKRIAEHNGEKKAAKYTRVRQPVTLVYSERHPNRSEALKREYAIKQLTRQEKLLLVAE